MSRKTAVVTDSGSGINQAEARELGINVLPMPFFINGKSYLEDITLTQEEFYRMLEEDAEVHTSQPAPGDVLDLWNRVLEEYDEIVYIPLSSALSSSYETAALLANDYDGRVQVVNNQRVSITQEPTVLDAMKLVAAGKSAAEVKEILEDEKYNNSIFLSLETLKYLLKGGRVTPLAAAMGTFLNLKPVLQIQGGKLDAYAKVRGKKAAKKTMLEAMKKEMEGKYHGADYRDFSMYLAYSHNLEEALEWKKEAEAAFPGVDFIMRPLSLVIASHTGPGIVAISCSKKLTV